MSDHAPNTEIHRADPALRRQLLWVLAILLVTGGAGLWALQQWLDALFQTLGQHNPGHLHTWLTRLVGGAALLVGSALAAGALWLYRLADDTRQQQRWPPSSLRVTQDLPVRRATEALAYAQQLRVSAIALGLMGACVLLWALWIGWPGPA